MVSQLPPPTKSATIYPESDGQPMADNTRQFRWIVLIKENLELLFALIDDVFIAGDLLWYPIEGNNTLSQAPDVMVVFGRPKGDRGSYKQWEEGNLAPQVVFEILSPSNRLKAMAKKLEFYDRYGVEEYYIYDPDRIDLIGWIRSGSQFNIIDDINHWVSPRLGVRFELTPDTLEIYRPDGERFLTTLELAQLKDQERQRADHAQLQADQERQRADQAQLQADQERQRAERLAAQLQAMGIDPNQV